jgi:hypothetical protein
MSGFECNEYNEFLKGEGGFEYKYLVIQVDIGGHPPFPNGSKQFSGHFGNLLFLAGFHFRGHFEGLNEVFFEIEVLNDIQRNN